MDILTVFWLRGLKNRGKSIFSQHLMARIVATETSLGSLCMPHPGMGAARLTL